MYSCDNCETGGFDIGELYPIDGGALLCKSCSDEYERDKSEIAFLEKRKIELEQWVKNQGDISLEQLMFRAYDEFIHFIDFGMVLHYYMKSIGKAPESEGN